MKSIPIKGYEGLYRIFPNGKVVSERRVIKTIEGRMRTIPAQAMKLYTSDDGWKYYRLSKEARVRERGVKTLVIEHFKSEKAMIPADVAAWMTQVMEDVSRLRVTIDSYQGSANVDQKIRTAMLEDLRKLTGRIKKLGYDDASPHP